MEETINSHILFGIFERKSRLGKYDDNLGVILRINKRVRIQTELTLKETGFIVVSSELGNKYFGSVKIWKLFDERSDY